MRNIIIPVLALLLVTGPAIRAVETGTAGQVYRYPTSSPAGTRPKFGSINLASVATVSNTVLGLTNGGTGVTTAAAITAELNALVGDSGSGGTKGLAPAPASGDTAAGKFLKADGTWTAPGGFQTVSATVFTSSGTYTKATHNATYVKLIVVGSGAGGAGAASSSAQADAAGGGGAGGICIRWLAGSSLGTTETVTIGAGGIGGNNGGGDGNPGNATSFGSWCTGNGGTGGTHSASGTAFGCTAGAVGGTATGGTLNIQGTAAGSACRLSGTLEFGSVGGDSLYGGGGKWGTNATGYGAGGGGNFDVNAGGIGAGGNGAAGIVIVEEYK